MATSWTELAGTGRPLPKQSSLSPVPRVLSVVRRLFVGCWLLAVGGAIGEGKQRKRAVPAINGRFQGVRACLSVEQDDSRDQLDGGENISSEFVVARGDSSVMLDFVEE